MIAHTRSASDMIEELAIHDPMVAAAVEARGMDAFVEDIRRGLDAILTAIAPVFVKLTDWILDFGAKLVDLLDRTERYARGQGRKKPRGRRAKERNRKAWVRFLEVINASNAHRAKRAA